MKIFSYTILNKKKTKKVKNLIYELIDAFRDDIITNEERINLKNKAYDLLLEMGLDKENK